MPTMTTSPRVSASTPATLRRFSITSFGHLICTASPRVRSTVSAAAIAPTSESCGRGRSAGRRRTIEQSSARSRRGFPLAAKASAARGLVVAGSDRTLGRVVGEQVLRRLALLHVGVGLPEAALRSG